MAKKLQDTPKEGKFLPILNFIKSNKMLASGVIFLLIASLISAIYFQCKANTGRTASATLWHDFKMIGLYFFGLFSSTISILVTKFNKWINE